MRKISLILLACILAGCDASSNFDGNASELSGTWQTDTVRIIQDDVSIDATYHLELTVDSSGDFLGELTLLHDGTAVSKAEQWNGRIEAPIITIAPFQFASSLGRLHASTGFSGQISERAITFEEGAFSSFPDGKLRFFPVR